jgi:hypothetical protein
MDAVTFSIEAACSSVDALTSCVPAADSWVMADTSQQPLLRFSYF